MKISMGKVLVLLLGLAVSSCRHTETNSTPLAQPSSALRVDPEVLATHKLDWTAKSNYVEIKVPYEPVAQLKLDVEKREGVSLKSRGEAHVTVLSPPEMTVLRTRLSLEQINGLMEKSNLQAIPIQLICLGRSQMKQGGRRLAVYYLVVQAPEILKVREKLLQQFIAAGGNQEAFVVGRIYPHITVGFSERDLHHEEGVIKDSRSCLYKVE